MTRRRRAVVRSRRTVLAIVAAALPMAVTAAVAFAWRSRLPAQVAADRTATATSATSY